MHERLFQNEPDHEAPIAGSVAADRLHQAVREPDFSATRCGGLRRAP